MTMVGVAPLYCNAERGHDGLCSHTFPAQSCAPLSQPQELWLEFIVDGHCSLCGNKGVIDTLGMTTPAGKDVGSLHYCICPNGRALKRQDADKEEWLNMQLSHFRF